MKKYIIFSILAIGCICAIIFACNSGNNTGNESEQDTVVQVKDLPLNISIYLDLSDRLERQMAPSQKERDIEIVMNLCEIIKNHAVANKILPCKDKIKVFFYPTPTDSKIALLADKLEMDLGKAKPAEKKKLLLSFEEEFKESLSEIYDSTLKEKNWIGSDIWGFFNKQVDAYCIKKDAKNVMAILTDGYIYYEPNKQQNGHEYNYVLAQTLKYPDSKLMVSRNGLNNLEVLMLEVNPTDPTKQNQLEDVLTTWFKEMGVQKIYVGETDVPSNTKLIIDNFFQQ